MIHQRNKVVVVGECQEGGGVSKRKLFTTPSMSRLKKQKHKKSDTVQARAGPLSMKMGKKCKVQGLY